MNGFASAAEAAHACPLILCSEAGVDDLLDALCDVAIARIARAASIRVGDPHGFRCFGLCRGRLHDRLDVFARSWRRHGIRGQGLSAFAAP